MTVTSAVMTMTTPPPPSHVDHHYNMHACMTMMMNGYIMYTQCVFDDMWKYSTSLS